MKLCMKSELSQEPSGTEVKEGIKRLKNGKAAGVSRIVGEMLKAGNDWVVKKLTQFIKRI